MKEGQFLPNIEIDVTSLPSRGLAYPKGSKVKYRTYMHGEIRKVSTSTIGIENSIRIAMDGIEADFGVKNLTLQDGIYIAILRKVSTLSGMKFEMPYVCEKCGEANRGVFSHTDITFQDISEDIESLPLYVDLKGKEIKISPMTIGDFLDLKSGKYDNIIKGDEIDRTATQAITIKNMSFAEAYDFIYTINTPEDNELITYIDKSIYHDIKALKDTCKAEGCGHENSIKLGGRDALISPFRGSEGASRARIRFISTPKPECISD